jgi:hypothetical protein
MNLTAKRSFFIGVFVLMIAIASAAFGQGITSSAMSGFVNDKSGKPVAGAVITALHEPSGTRSSAVTRSNGQYSMTGLRPGGPYTVSVSGAGVQYDPQKDVFITLNDDANISFGPGADVVKMEAFTVAESSNSTFGTGRMGTGQSFNEDQIQNITATRDNVQDIARLDSRLTLNSLDQGGQLSAQGQNFRFNSFLVDGVESNDPFGLKGDGTNALRSPVALDSLQAIDIQLTPFDVRRAGFTGVLINTITKSGSNEFHGAVKYEYTDQDYRAKNPNPASALYNTREPFKERTINYSLGGPILRDRLFFYVNYDDYKRTAAPPATSFKYTDQTQIDAITARAKAIGYDIGSLGGAGSTVSTQKTKFAKLDWNISDGQRLTASYRNNEGTTPVFAGLTSNFGQSYSNYWYDAPQKSTVYTAVLNSQWTSALHTEATLTYTEWDGSPKNRGTPFPAVQINGLTGVRGDTGATITTGSVLFGTEFSRQLNQVNTKDWQGKLHGDYSLGDHTITVGGESDQIKYYNAFAQGFYGSYTFANVASWVAGTPVQTYTDAKLNPGFTLDDAIAKWKYTAYAAYVQDTWKPNARLTLVGGLRLDYPYVPQKPTYLPSFTTAFGMRNDTNNDGNYTIAPRIGFNYRVPADRKTELRGGIGLFQGRNPAVWLSNAYSQAGVLGTVSNATGVTFSPDVTKQPTPAGTLAAPNINVTDPNFKQPAVWKGNLAVDHKLPFFDLIFTAEVDAIQTYKALAIQFLNYQVANDGGPGVTPDGRIRYAGTITPGFGSFPATSLNGRRRVTTGGPTGGGFADVFYLTNTSKGDQHSVTLSLNRPMKNNWSAGLSWTRGRATEVSPMTSSTAGSLYNVRAVYNPNEDVASRSNTDTQDKIVASVTRQFSFFSNAKTSATLAYVGQTGHTYSWVFTGDANGDGFTTNDLFYMPTQNDPKVRWTSPAEQQAFFAYAAANDLMKYQGQVLPRNGFTSPWNNDLDLTVIQDLPGAWRLKPQIILNWGGFGNFINKNWGLLEEIPFNYKRTIAGTTYDRTANQYVYTFSQSTFSNASFPITTLDPLQSRWHLKIALKLSF